MIYLKAMYFIEYMFKPLLKQPRIIAKIECMFCVCLLCKYPTNIILNKEKCPSNILHYMSVNHVTRFATLRLPEYIFFFLILNALYQTCRCSLLEEASVFEGLRLHCAFFSELFGDCFEFHHHVEPPTSKPERATKKTQNNHVECHQRRRPGQYGRYTLLLQNCPSHTIT